MYVQKLQYTKTKDFRNIEYCNHLYLLFRLEKNYAHLNFCEKFEIVSEIIDVRITVKMSRNPSKKAVNSRSNVGKMFGEYICIQTYLD